MATLDSTAHQEGLACLWNSGHDWAKACSKGLLAILCGVQTAHHQLERQSPTRQAQSDQCSSYEGRTCVGISQGYRCLLQFLTTALSWTSDFKPSVPTAAWSQRSMTNWAIGRNITLTSWITHHPIRWMCLLVWQPWQSTTDCSPTTEEEVKGAVNHLSYSRMQDRTRSSGRINWFRAGGFSRVDSQGIDLPLTGLALSTCCIKLEGSLIDSICPSQGCLWQC